MIKNNVNNHLLVIPTDKTNSYQVLETYLYDKLVKKHILKNGEEVERSRIVEIYEKSHKLLTKHSEIFSKNEYYAIRSSIEKRDISTPKILVKDHN